MASLDWVIIATYLLGMVAMSVVLGRGQKSSSDYYLGGRDLPWWALGLSIMATQSSSVGLVSIPAFVALKPGGGLTWLEYEIALPLALAVVLLTLVPLLRRLELTTVYEYLELRYGSSVRFLLSAVFLVSRAMAASVYVYSSAIVVSACVGLPLWSTVMIIGIVTVVYDTIGGMKAVVYSDVLQTIVLVAGVGWCIVALKEQVGGWSAIVDAMPAERWQTFEWKAGWGDEASAPLWAYVFGGFVLLTSYYGVDQSQTQRMLSAPSVRDAQSSVLVSALARFPLTLLYVALGMAALAAYQTMPSLQAAIPEGKPDFLIPSLIVEVLPTGVRAILVAALLAASMSSLDSALNSISAVTVKDFVQRGRSWTERSELLASKSATVMWGSLITVVALFMDRIAPTVVEAVNKIGSAFFGPTLAVFVVGALSRRVRGPAIFVGTLLGVGTNLALWLTSADVHWMWWNVIGFVVTGGFALVLSLRSACISDELARRTQLTWRHIFPARFDGDGLDPAKVLLGLSLYTIVILGCMAALHRLASA